MAHALAPSRRTTLTRLGQSLLAGATLVAGLSLTAPVHAYDLRFGHGGTEDTAYHLGATRFKELLEEQDVDLGVQIMGNSVLGHETEMFEQLMAGALDMSIVNPGLITDFSDTANVFSIPFLYRDQEHWQTVLDGDVGREIADQITAETGVKVLAFFGGGKRQIVSSRPLESLDDLDGMKLRTNPTKPLITAWSALGTDPTVMAWKEIYTGLQLGAIDGLLNEAEWIHRMRFHEVAPHIGLSEHDITVRLLTMSELTWDRLDDAQQEAVMAAASQAASYARGVQLEQDAEALELLVEEGATLHELDREQMQQIVREPLAEVIDEMGLSELHQMIVNAE
ncbi:MULTISPECIES: TRAP transporter substrate-binding protein [Halomonas]|uniref:TRAP transporter substrate-binding protein n=1 Tax=Halomonas TaxID=2745 RepID=UPI001A8F64E1|nr:MULTISPECIES: TRAP transporter substrate-binding protein [Halomonas]MED5297053.1 TRAP transporter substrate-binding protein [Pseudomonadota bacterium]MBN8413055.1 TRAP transporter substrate-binding protein [Halomonas litopenaei]MBY6206575.1 TRAP transporter substrate-binding protein [Halomonas sp. DP3Y7-2]MBY6227534.1 TRAP transporter substrate-binding protein [Halomonas sp. DP3Y7-1]MCA0915598.1 TRAP transporter substrate-binding protein [Halomonas denitrificans]